MSYKTGLKPTDPAKPILEIDSLLTGVIIPPSDDHFSGVQFALDGNDRFGTCGPTSVDNLTRLVSKGLTGTQHSATEAEVFQLYRESGNPNFNPNEEGSEDNGVEMGTMLDALLKDGLGPVKPVAFGRSKKTDDASINELVAVFGGVLFAVNLLVAQQGQTEQSPPKWDYKPGGEWGGHAICAGKYFPEGTGDDIPVISWQKEVETTDSFRTHQLEEVWVVIYPWHLEHPAFLAGVDVNKLAEVFKALTGKTFPVPPAPPAPKPEPTPEPVPPIPPEPTPKPPVPTEETTTASDREYWAAIEGWARKLHWGENKRAAKAAIAWAKAKHLA